MAPRPGEIYWPEASCEPVTVAAISAAGGTFRLDNLHSPSTESREACPAPAAPRQDKRHPGASP
jgi:hypothetical protein